MHVLKPGTPQHLEMCQMKIIYRTFHILEIRVWVSTEGVSTKGYLFFPFFFLGGGGLVLFCFFILPIARDAYYLHKPSGWK